MFGIISLISSLVWIFSERDLFQVTRTDTSLFFTYFLIFEQVTLYFCLMALVYCIVGIALCRFVSYRPLFLGTFHSSFTSAFSLSCTDLCNVSTDDSDHGVPKIAILLVEIEGLCIYIQCCFCLTQV